MFFNVFGNLRVTFIFLISDMEHLALPRTDLLLPDLTDASHLQDLTDVQVCVLFVLKP